MSGEQKIMQERGALWHPPYLALHQRELVRVDSTPQVSPGIWTLLPGAATQHPWRAGQ